MYKEWINDINIRYQTMKWLEENIKNMLKCKYRQKFCIRPLQNSTTNKTRLLIVDDSEIILLSVYPWMKWTNQRYTFILREVSSMHAVIPVSGLGMCEQLPHISVAMTSLQYYFQCLVYSRYSINIHGWLNKD